MNGLLAIALAAAASGTSRSMRTKPMSDGTRASNRAAKAVRREKLKSRLEQRAALKRHRKAELRLAGQ